MTIYEALAAVMADVDHVGKDGRNDSQGFRFRGIDHLLNAVGPALRRHRVVILPELIDAAYESVEVGKNRTPMRQATVKMAYRFVAVDGSEVRVIVPGEALDSGDKATTKALSQALKYALVQTLAIPTDEPDPDAESFERAPAVDLDAEARAAGFVDEADRTAQHVEVAKLHRRLAGQDVKGWRAEHGWPVTRAELEALRVELDKLAELEEPF